MSDTEERALRPANENPWYCLATLYGEQPADGWNQQLAEKNHSAWSRFIGGGHLSNADQLLFTERTKDLSLATPDPKSTADFSCTQFDCPVDFSGFSFPKPSDFQSAIFFRDVKFQGAAFNAATNFKLATFCGESDFRRAQFNSGGDFQSATFSKKAHFQDVYNFVDANFQQAKFTAYGNFNRVKFYGGTANFTSTTFLSGVDFARAEFNAGAAFRLATFSNAADFNATKFNIASFNAARFSDRVTFINAEFSGSVTFANARFNSVPPDFRGAKMHEATEWHGVTWPKPPSSKDDAQRQVYNYERLKQEMEQRKKHHDEQNFFRMELRARRGLIRTFSPEWLLNFAYQALCDYGNSYMRPLAWLFAVFAAGTAIFARAPMTCSPETPPILS